MPVIESKFQRCEEDDPHRCQANVANGQCPYKAMVNMSYCPMHNAAGNAIAAKKNVRNYNLGKWQARVNDFADNDKVKSLREEIGIMRMMLETIMDKCTDATELLIQSTRIGDMVIKIEKLVASCQRLEEKTDVLIDKQKAMMIADLVISVVTMHITDPKIIDAISNDIQIRMNDAQYSDGNGEADFSRSPTEKHNEVFPMVRNISEDGEEYDSELDDA